MNCQPALQNVNVLQKWESELTQLLLNDATLFPERIAELAHEINRGYCLALGDTSQLSWEDAPDWQKESAINGVRFHLSNPDATPEDSHNSWLKQKEEEGWTYGEVKDVEKKTHPCFLPYNELPQEQRAKDYLFRTCVHAAETVLSGQVSTHIQFFLSVASTALNTIHDTGFRLAEGLLKLQPFLPYDIVDLFMAHCDEDESEVYEGEDDEGDPDAYRPDSGATSSDDEDANEATFVDEEPPF